LRFVIFGPTPIDFFQGALALQAKVDLDLPKFELLLSATKEFVRQVLSSSEEGIPFSFELIQGRDLVSQGKL
jgi:hypothetical protein